MEPSGRGAPADPGAYFRTAPVNTLLAALNILFFLFLETHGGSNDPGTMLTYGAVYGPLVVNEGEYWRLLTAAFMHFGITHIANNMLLLLIMGRRLEQVLGHARYLVLYLLSALAGNVFSLWFSMQTGDFGLSAGASGAVFGVIGGLLWAVMRNKGRLLDLNERQITIFAGLSFYYGLTAEGVDNAAHFGGAVAGFLLCMLLYRGGGEAGRPTESGSGEGGRSTESGSEEGGGSTEN